MDASHTMRASLAPNAPRVALSRAQRRAPGGRGVAGNRAARVTTRASSSPIDVAKTDNAVDGVGFSAAGMIFPYHVGAWQVLRERGLMTPDTPVAGASAGALVAAMHACGIAPDDGNQILLNILRDCRENGVVGRVGAVLERALRDNLPNDAHVRCGGGKLHVSITAPFLIPLDNALNENRNKNRVGFNNGPVALDNEMVSTFDTRDDLIAALLSSCHIPVYCGWPARMYRGRYRVDGGWTRLTPTPPGSTNSVSVASFPLIDAWTQAEAGDGTARGNFFAKKATFWEDWGERDARGLLIAPDAAGGCDCPLDYVELGKWALLPQDDATLEELVRMGRRDAERWAECTGRGDAIAVADADDAVRAA